MEATRDLNLIRVEARLHPEGAPGPALAGEAVADRDGERLARHLELELPAVAGGMASGHPPKASQPASRGTMG